ncbi:hypothetical protein B0H16DRAFT_1719786 [Mycena metata]|uniref:Secreted protein n=1 Tax=Mycena metata TaxID=1033252 RepID=A0AAD7JB31_9AGAR|nr:hypothetical protein B0H16DRAFT_1719786 [Mycena metata]
MFAFLCQVLTRVSLVTSAVETARCRAVATAARAASKVIDGVFLVAAGGLKLATKKNIQPAPTKTTLIWLPPTTTPFPAYTAPMALWVILVPMAVAERVPPRPPRAHRLILKDLSKAVVDDLDVAAGVEDDVVGLEITVDDTALVHCTNRFGLRD